MGIGLAKSGRGDFRAKRGINNRGDRALLDGNLISLFSGSGM